MRRARCFQLASHTPAPSRHILPELCCSHRPRRRRGRREDRVPAGTRGPLCANALETDAQRHTGEAKHPAFPAQWLYGLCRALPGERCTIAPVALRMGDLRTRSGPHITARLGAQAPGARTTRFCRTRAAPVVCAWVVAHGVGRPANLLRADAARVHHVPSRVRDDRDNAPRPGWDGRNMRYFRILVKRIILD